MIERIKRLIRRNDMCVLATCHKGQPHCSLMAYLADEKAVTIYMATRKETSKYKYLVENPRVSLLIDTRTEKDLKKRAEIQALTISGICTPVAEPAKADLVRRQIVEHHPHLGALVEHPDAAIIEVHIESFLLLDGAMSAYHVTQSDMPP